MNSQLSLPLPRKLAGLLLGLGISALAFWWAMPKDGLRSLPGYVASARASTLLLAVVVATSTFLIRAARWRLLLKAEGGAPPSWGAAWHATTIGFMANNVLPFRLGEIVRALTLSRLDTTPFPAAVASIAVERVFDALAVVGLFAFALAGSDVGRDLTVGGHPAAQFIRLVGILGVGALIAAAVGGLYPDAAERLLRAVVPWKGLADKLAGPLRAFAHGLQVLHDPRRIALVVLGSVALWVINAWSFGIAFQAFGLPGSLQVALIVQMFVVFGVALPAAPGYIGVFELAIIIGLKLFAVEKNPAFAAGLTYHVLTYIPITLLGAWSLSRTGLKLGGLRQSPTSGTPDSGLRASGPS
ncbi:MAG TPA: lysylphosphatidylglycerol synthase transmembrane domain-containing protein [Anaeromyxobacteraceae bacterium]|nr:lysylphosphatidylglycerol synthase transmembrane domain-containing protein [Anaeromyxobacteraceae bacterium]